MNNFKGPSQMRPKVSPRPLGPPEPPEPPEKRLECSTCHYCAPESKFRKEHKYCGLARGYSILLVLALLFALLGPVLFSCEG